MKKKSRTNKSNSIIKKLLIGGVPKKVLVMCQRKTGLSDTVNPYKVEDIIVPKINLLIRSLFGNDDISVIYMSDIRENEGTVDINCNLNGINECSKKFISENKNSFDLIILQTCPLYLMKYSILHSLLKPNGMLGVTAMPYELMREERIFDVSNNVSRNIPKKLFEIEANDDFFLALNIILYSKVNRDGGADKKRSRRK